MIITKKRYLTRKVMLSVLLPGVFSVLLLNACGKKELLPVSSELIQETALLPETEGELRTAESAGEDLSIDTDRQETGAESEAVYWYVHVCGAVNVPGVYLLPEGSRCFEAIEMAGGLREDARSDLLNLASVLQDGMKLRVPDIRETEGLSPQEAENLLYQSAGLPEGGSADFGGGSPSENGSGRSLVNINTADAALLCTLPGIGETRARQIIAYRESHGNFSSCEDIMNVTGIKAGLYDQIRDLICI